SSLQSAIAGTLSVIGGTVTTAADIVDGGGTSNVILNGGTLDLAGHNLGTSSGPIDNIASSFQSGTLKNVAEINGGGVGLTKTTTGTLTIAGSNTYTGNTTVGQGTLLLGANYAIGGSATPTTPSKLVLSGGTFASGGFNNTFGALSLAGSSNID